MLNQGFCIKNIRYMTTQTGLAGMRPIPRVGRRRRTLHIKQQMEQDSKGSVEGLFEGKFMILFNIPIMYSCSRNYRHSYRSTYFSKLKYWIYFKFVPSRTYMKRLPLKENNNNKSINLHLPSVDRCFIPNKKYLPLGILCKCV